ncbi:MAG: glycosyltransferase family 2 protein [Sphingobacteriaceae bacterium]|nr:MAG: glycosyltransferase family 2 protein [Sphingobacteriaceae bacterium]
MTNTIITATDDKVTILMATYNGAKYIQKQFDSIINQTYTHWELIVRDDGSNDDTVAIIKSNAAADDRILLIDVKSSGRGACSNFSALYAWAKENRAINYLMFTDQDDVWKADKVKKTLQLLKSDEHKTPGIPLLAYGNLQLVDDNLQVLPETISLIKDFKLKHVLSRNYAFGCTMMLNKQLLTAMDEIYAEASNHDYWVALFAAAFGKTIFIEEELILYRQHDSNVSGHTIGNQKMNNRIKRYTSGVNKQIEEEKVKLKMLGVFYNKYKSDMVPGNKKLLFALLSSFNSSRLAVIATMMVNGITRKGFIQTLVSYYFVLVFYTEIKYKFAAV